MVVVDKRKRNANGEKVCAVCERVITDQQDGTVWAIIKDGRHIITHTHAMPDCDPNEVQVEVKVA